jgi:hypothetical protein
LFINKNAMLVRAEIHMDGGPVASYDFGTLSSHDFELIVRDLLQKHLGLNLESFKSGRDRGIDLRYAKSKQTNDLVVQCKHFRSSPFKTLLSHLRIKESPKVSALKPKRYILATSQGLTPDNKLEIARALLPTVVAPADILGMDDLNNLLGQYPEVEKQHFKLWLNSSAILERVLHAEVFNRSEVELRAIQRKIMLFVQNQSFFRATEILQQSHYCIVSGIPGIGKTTLAEMLIVLHLAQGFEIYKIGESISEAFKVLNPDRPQLFYYDDFLGQVHLGDQLKKNEDDLLIKFADHLSRTPNHRLILTTREYILQQAQQNYEKLGTSSLDLAKCMLNLTDYSLMDRGRILFNHLYFSGLDSVFIDELLKDRRYLRLIRHQNFSPRIVEWMTIALATKGISSSQYFEVFLKNLDSPSELWRHAFEKQISHAGRALVLALASLPADVFIDDAEVAFQGLYALQAKTFSWTRGIHDFRNALRETDGTFIRSKRVNGKLIINFHNPSISDFIVQYLKDEPPVLDALISSAMFFSQVRKVAVVLDSRWGIPVPKLPPLSGPALEAIHKLIGRDAIRSGEDCRPRYSSFESDLRFLLEGSGSQSPEVRQALVGPLIDRLLERAQTGSVDRRQFPNCFTELDKDPRLYGGKRPDLVRVGNSFMGSELENWEDCSYLADWIDLIPDASIDPAIAQAVETIASVLENDVDYYSKENSNPTELRSAAEDITGVANRFGIVLDIEALVEKASAIEDDYDPYAGYERDDYSGGGGEGSESEIEDLFSLLNERNSE